MNTVRRTHLLTGTLCVLTALLAGCSAGSGNGLGKAGKQSSVDPEAVITPIGHVLTSNGVLQVRSGAEVVLSGKDSSGGDSAILGFSWAPANTAAGDVQLLERGGTAVSFRAPLPPDTTPVELRFRLTIRTADGDTGSSEVRVLVGRVPDPDDFLLTELNDSADDVNFAILPSALQGFATLQANLPFEITIQKRIHYNRAKSEGPDPSANPAADDPVYCAASAPTNTCVKVGAVQHLNGAWLQSAGIYGLNAAGFSVAKLFTAYQNPRFRIRPPAVNADEVNFAVLSGSASNNGTGVPASDTRRNNLLFTADIDAARADYVITFTPDPSAAAQNVRSVLVVAAANVNSVTDRLTAVAAETDEVPGGPVTVIVSNASLASVQTAGVVETRNTALAYYAAIDPNQRRTTLEDWLKDNCLQPTLPGNYGADLRSTYLNDRDLGFGREMYFKTDCTTEQRGATGATLNTNAGERASIVFNYPSLEAAIKRSGSFLAVAMEYRADEQNGGIPFTRFYTFAPDPRTGSWKRVLSANFDGRRERLTPGNCTVCHGGKPKASYASGADIGATFIPWDARALLFADTDASIVDERVKTGYRFADQEPKIRALNLQGVLPILTRRKQDTAPTGESLSRWDAALDVLGGWYPAGGGAANYSYVPSAWHGISSPAAGLSSDDLYLKVFAENCRMCHLQRILEPSATTGVLTQALAPQFRRYADVDGKNDLDQPLPAETDKIATRVFTQHVMPASRLTADRFWLPQGGATQSGAAVLASHLGLTGAAAIPQLLAAASEPPAVVEPDTDSATVRLSGLGSRFAASYSWTLEKPAGSAAVLVGATTAEPAFRADQSGVYRVRLKVTDAGGHEDDLDTPLDITADRKPHAADFAVAAASGQFITVALPFYGVVLGDGSNTLTASHNMPGTSLGYPSFCTSSGVNSGANCRINFTATGGGTINYQLTDADGDVSQGTITVTVSVPSEWAVGTFSPVLNCAANAVGCATDILNIRAAAVAALNISDAQFTSLGYTAQLSVTQAPARTGQGGGSGSATLSGNFLRYTSPAYFVSTQSAGGSALLDTFRFRILVRNSSSALVSQSAEGIVQPNVVPRQRWSGVLGILQNGTCNSSGCHADAPSGGRAWGTLTVAGANSNGVNTYTQLRSAGCPAAETAGTAACIQFGALPRNSLLLHKPLGEYNHYYKESDPSTTLGYDAGLTPTQLEVIRDWILDGAYQN